MASKRLYGLGDSPDQRKAVQWFDPGVLATAGLEVVFSIFQNRNLDRREEFVGTRLGVLAPGAVDLSRHDDEFWFDFLSDTGDGGDATYSVLSTMLAPQVEHRGQPLPRGNLIVLGGDLAYPEASPEEYQYRFVDLFMAANRQPTAVTSMTQGLVAIPQNHDWYDNVSTFCRYFANRNGGRVFAESIPVLQRATYFATQLPRGWWIFGLDFAHLGDIDRAQFESFVALVSTLPADARVILVYPEPYWVKDERETRNDGMPKRFQRLEALIGLDRIRLRIAGDLHHFADHASTQGDRLITCGTGGAFLHPTHTRDTSGAKVAQLEDNPLTMTPEWAQYVRVRQADRNDPSAPAARAHPERRYDAKYLYPQPARCRAMAWWLPLGFGIQNWKFALVLGGLYWLNAWLNAFLIGVDIGSIRIADISRLGFDEFGAAFSAWFQSMVYQMPSAMLNLLMILACARFSRSQGPRFRWIAGIVHGLVHAFAVFLIFWGVTWWAMHVPWLDGIWRELLEGLLIFAIGAVVGSIIFGAFLAIAVNVFGQHQNESFSAMRVADYKGFLRFCIRKNGVLTGYFVQIDKVCREWHRSNDANAPVWSPGDGRTSLGRVEHEFNVP
jgi:hypothetical protein